MQEYLSNEFSFGPQQITTWTALGSVALWIPEPYAAQGEEEQAREGAAALYSTVKARSVYAKKIILELC